MKENEPRKQAPRGAGQGEARRRRRRKRRDSDRRRKRCAICTYLGVRSLFTRRVGHDGGGNGGTGRVWQPAQAWVEVEMGRVVRGVAQILDGRFHVEGGVHAEQQKRSEAALFLILFFRWFGLAGLLSVVMAVMVVVVIIVEPRQEMRTLALQVEATGWFDRDRDVAVDVRRR